MAVTLSAGLKLMDGMSAPLTQVAAQMARTAQAGDQLSNALSRPVAGDFGAAKVEAVAAKLSALQGQYDAQTAQLGSMDQVYEGMVQGAMAASAEVDRLMQRQVALNAVMANSSRGSSAYITAQMELSGLGAALDNARQKAMDTDTATNKYFESLNRASERQANLSLKIAGTQEALNQERAAMQANQQASASARAASVQAFVAKAQEAKATQQSASASTQAAVANAREAAQLRQVTAWVQKHHMAEKQEIPTAQKSLTLRERLCAVFGRFGASAAGASGGVNQLTGSMSRQNGVAGNLMATVKRLLLAYAGFSAIKNLITESTAAFMDQREATTKLVQVMSNTMGAGEVEMRAVLDTTAAQDAIGVIGDEIQIAGSQELGTYLEQASSLQTLIPVMNDMLAQQYGLNASQENAINIGTMLGKVMQGQTGALKRYGYEFTDAQKKILETGTEAQRVATLFDVVNESVGGVNAALAQTDIGRLHQAKNALGDIKEKIGQLAVPFQSNFMVGLVSSVQMAMPYVVQLATVLYSLWTSPAAQMFGQMLYNGAIMAVQGITWLITNLGALTPIIAGVMLAVMAYNAVLGVTNLLQWASGAAAGVKAAGDAMAAGATFAATAAQYGFNAALLACPITWIVLAIVALIVVLGFLIIKFQAVRDAIAKIMGAIARFVGTHVEVIVKLFQDAVNAIIGMINAVIDGLNALGMSIDKIQEVDWASKVAGLGAKMGASVESGVKNGLDKASDAVTNFGDLLKGQSLDTGSFAELPQIAANTGAMADTVGSGGGGGGGGGGKAVKTTDADKEDTELLKLLVEYGKAKNIQNFISLQPNIAVSNNKFDTTVQADPDVIAHQIGLTVLEEAVVMIPEVVPV